MRLWVFLLSIVIVSALFIWGCTVIIDWPEPVTAEVSDNDFTSLTAKPTLEHSLS